MVKALPLRLVGWKFEGEKPAVKKCVVLAFPHTSNWDGLLLVALTKSIGLEMSWMIKDDWFKGPMATVLRGIETIPVDRKGAHNLVEQMVAEFAKHDSFTLVIPPEGTRRRSETWRSGFYHIARGANVAVVPGYLDYGRKRAGLGPPIDLTGDVKADMDRIRAFYATVNPQGKVPEYVGPIALRDETASPT